MNSEENDRSQFCCLFQPSVEGSVFVTPSTGGSAVNIEFFGKPETSVFLSSEGEEGMLNWFTGNIITEIVNDRLIFVPVFQHSPVCAASRKKRSQLITERVLLSQIRDGVTCSYSCRRAFTSCFFFRVAIYKYFREVVKTEGEYSFSSLSSFWRDVEDVPSGFPRRQGRGHVLVLAAFQRYENYFKSIANLNSVSC